MSSSPGSGHSGMMALSASGIGEGLRKLQEKLLQCEGSSKAQGLGRGPAYSDLDSAGCDVPKGM